MSSIAGSEDFSYAKKMKSPADCSPGTFSSNRNFTKSPQNVSPSRERDFHSVAGTERAILDHLNYFIDQFTNLHAVCNKALEVDESVEELHLVHNVLSQDLK